MLKELFRTDAPKTLRQRMPKGTIEGFQEAINDIEPGTARDILTDDERKLRIDTLLNCTAVLARELTSQWFEIRALKRRVAELEGNGG